MWGKKGKVLRILSRCALSWIRQVIVEERQQRDSWETAEGGALRCKVAFSLGVIKNSPQSSKKVRGCEQAGLPTLTTGVWACAPLETSLKIRGVTFTLFLMDLILFSKAVNFLKHTMTQADKEGQLPAARRWAENWSPHIKIVKMIDGNDPGDAVPATTWHTCEFPSCG